MDLGLSGRRALVCAASKGLGQGCALALAREGVAVVITARTAETLEATAEEIRARDRRHGHRGGGRHRHRGRPGRGARGLPEPDILVNNAGGPPPGDFRDWDRDAWIRALDANMLAPIALIKATVDGMIDAQVRPDRQHHLRRREGADRSISACRTAPAPGLTGFVAGLARQTVAAQRDDQQPAARPVRHRPDPQQRRSRRRQGRHHGRGVPRGRGPATTRPAASASPTSSAPPARSCAAGTAGFITGQNLLMDGGAYPGTF